MSIPIIMPQLGESIAEATIVHFPCNVGDLVAADQDVIEVETNKATMGVTTPCSGRLAEFTVSLQQTYAVGTVLGVADASFDDIVYFGATRATIATRKT